MSGLLALLDDVATIAKVAAASLDDVAGQAAKAGAKAAGVVIDDAAVTPKYVHGFDAHRELPIIRRIAMGSLRNKLVILLPAALVLSAVAPWAITLLLALGGGYLCFEGAEKVLHALSPHAAPVVAAPQEGQDPVHLEEEKIRGAIKTDFILSAEIMTIALAAIPDGSLWAEALTLAIVGAGITALVYGGVALIVKMDDLGLVFAERGRTRGARALGRGLVRAMPRLMTALSVIGTAAMLWVGGAIVIHGLEVAGWAWLGHHIHDLALVAAEAAPPVLAGLAGWLAGAVMDGAFGLALGLVLVPVATRLIGPLARALSGRPPAPH